MFRIRSLFGSLISGVSQLGCYMKGGRERLGCVGVREDWRGMVYFVRLNEII